METSKKRTHPVLTKKAYAAFSDKITQILNDQPQKTQLILGALREETHFDPESNTYDPEQGRKKMESKKRRAEELGISVYQLTNAHKYYEKNKFKNKDIS